MDLLNEGFTTSRFIKHGNALAFSGCRGSANKSVEDKVVKNVVTDSVLHYDFKP